MRQAPCRSVSFRRNESLPPDETRQGTHNKTQNLKEARHVDRSGDIRFRRWRFYAEAGRAKKEIQISIDTSTLKVEYEETELAFSTVAWHEDNKHITEVSNPRVIETNSRSAQLTRWTLGPDERLLCKNLPDYAPVPDERQWK